MSEALFTPDGLVLTGASDYARTMNELVLPYNQARREDMTILGQGDKPLFVSRYLADKPRGTVVLVHGFTETGDKFAELVHSLLRQGWNALTYDQRGHGQSWRPQEVSDPSLTHVDAFQDYVEDLHQVCLQVLSRMAQPWHIFAHSMGGAVTALCLEQWPETFRSAALCAPMIAPNRGGVPLWLSRVLCRGAIMLGQGKKRIFMSKPYAGPEDFATGCATDAQRFAWYDQLKAATPSKQNNGPTYAWTLASVNVTDTILADGAVEKIACPVALYQAEDDNSVLPEPQEAFIRRVKQGSFTRVAGSRHEIYRSTDGVLFPWWHEILTFFEKNS